VEHTIQQMGDDNTRTLNLALLLGHTIQGVNSIQLL